MCAREKNSVKKLHTRRTAGRGVQHVTYYRCTDPAYTAVGARETATRWGRTDFWTNSVRMGTVLDRASAAFYKVIDFS